MNRLSTTLRNFRHGASRVWLAGVAIAVSVAFVVAGTMVANAASILIVEQKLTMPWGTTAVLSAKEGRLPASAAAWGVPSSERTIVVLGPDKKAELDGGRRVFAADDRAVRLVSGVLPGSSGEVGLDSRTAQILGVSPGGQVNVRASDGDVLTMRVSGIAEPRTGTIGLVANLDAMSRLLGSGIDQIQLRGDDDENAEAAAAIGGGAALRDVRQQLADEAEKANRGLAELGLLMSALTLVAGVAGTFVIANTFYVVAASRRREAALLRAVGASQRQVRRMFGTEALILGGAASVVGALLGAGVGRLASTAMGVGVTPSLLLMLGGVVLGLLTTMIGTWAPVRSIARVAPVEALGSAEVTEAEIPSRARWLLALPLLAMAAMVLQVRLVGAVVGGVLTFLTIVVLGPILAPRIAALFMRRRGPVADLAKANVMRHPKRSARTSAAVLLGVALATSVAALTSAIGGVDQLFPRGEVTVYVPTVTPEIAERLGRIEGVDRVAHFRPSEITLHTRSSRADDVSADVAAMLPAWPGARLADAQDKAAEIQSDLAWVTTSLGAVAVMSLVVGLLGVLNTVRLSAQERRREFAVLRAIGMTRRQLVGLVVAEAAGMTSIGVFLGLVLGAATIYGMLGALSVLLIPLVSWWLVFLICTLVVGVSALGATAPALAASRVHPARAMADTSA